MIPFVIPADFNVSIYSKEKKKLSKGMSIELFIILKHIAIAKDTVVRGGGLVSGLHYLYYRNIGLLINATSKPHSID